MTEQIKSAIYCLGQPALQELCEKCTHYDDCDGDNYVKEYIDLSIRSLQAWEEVLQELEEERDRFNRCKLKGEVIGIVSAIEVIKQKLEGATE